MSVVYMYFRGGGGYSMLEFLLSVHVGKACHRRFYCTQQHRFQDEKNLLWFSEILERKA